MVAGIFLGTADPCIQAQAISREDRIVQLDRRAERHLHRAAAMVAEGIHGGTRMKTRHVFSTRNVVEARSALLALGEQGVGFDDISLVARSDIELERVPDTLKEADTDFLPAAMRGMGVGGATGLLAGLAAVVFTPIGITLAGAAAIGAMGALVGGWSSALMGSALPDPVRQQFDDEISAGRILVLVDAEPEAQPRLQSALEAVGAQRLDYAAPTAMT